MHELSKIALGTVQFGLDYGIANQSGKPNYDEISDILGFSLKTGITTLDTASAYGDSEKVLGEYGVSSFNVITKFLPKDQNLSLEESLQNSLVNLNSESVYGFLAHRPEALDVIAWSKMNDLKADGKVKKIGYSLQSVAEFEIVMDKGFIPDLVQVPFNLFDHRFKEICIDLKNRDVEVHTRSTFLQGLFFLKENQFNDHFMNVKQLILDLQNKYQDTLAQILLNYALQQDFIDKVIIGVQSKNQLIQNISFLKKSSNIEEIHDLISEDVLNPALWPKN